ncbi:hypothetical protein [Micromonospora globbae]|uniref:hypothetical protein n=1 Tax=Micromonospora globbae TaxID=1894969 RepID=UPI003437DA17
MSQPIADHPHTDPGDGRTECDVCGKYVWPATHSCKGVPVTERALARLRKRQAYPTEQCRSCPAQIIWAVTERGKPMPVNAEPVPGGNVLLTERHGQLTAVVVPAHRAFGRKDLRTSHFVDCPDAAKWRRR